MAAPAFAVFESWGTTSLAPSSFVTHRNRFLWYTSRSARPPPSLLWRGLSPLHHDQLLSAPAAARRGAKSRSAPAGPGARAAALSLCGGGLRGYARARASLAERAGARRSVEVDAGHQARLRTRATERAARRRRPASGQFVDERAPQRPHLAGAILRLRGVHGEEADRKAELYASQSGKAGTRGVSGGVAVEQLSPLCGGRARDRSSK